MISLSFVVALVLASLLVGGLVATGWLLRRAARGSVDQKPAVLVQPGMRFGQPHIRGIGVDAIADLVWAGEAVDVVADEYDLTRDEVILACWHRAQHGGKRWRRRWAGWLAEANGLLWHGRYAEVADPPSRKEEGVDG